MFKRILLGAIVVASLAWIIYYALDIASEKNNYVPEIVFSQEDEQLLVVVRSDEVNFDVLEGFKDAPALEIMKSLADSSYDIGYFSKKRDHLILVSEKNWNKASIKKAFGSKTPQFSGGSTFTIGDYNGSYYKTKLYLSKGQIEQKGSENNRFDFDKKASACIFTFSNDSIKNQTDIYFKKGGHVDYITRNAGIEQGSQVKDEVIFAGMVSRNISSYHFYERDFYATLDPEFTQSPMFQWMLNGFTIVEYDGETAIISDYIGGQDPVLVLNDINQTLDTTRFSNRLTKDFPSEGKSYTIKYLEDLVVIAEKTSTCDKILADYKLGNTIASSTTDRYRYYGELPRSVSERFVSSEKSYSKAVYQGKLMETHTGISDPVEPKQLSATVNMSCGFDISDFEVLPGKGNVVALGKDGDLACFSKGQLKWKKKLPEKAIGGIQIIDLHYNGEKYVLVNTSSKIYLWSLNGKEASGFPIAMESSAVNQVKFYRWRERSYFLIASEDKKVFKYDSKGREHDVFKSEHDIKDQIDIWVSQNRLFAGFTGNSQFTMFEVDKRRALRSFEILPLSYPVKFPNQLFRYAITDGKLIRMDQKSNRENLDKYPNGKILKVIDDKSTSIIVVQSGNQLQLLNEQGIGFSQINLPFSEIADVFVKTNDSGKTYVCVIDGLENNVYLFGTDGSRLNTKALEGQTEVSFHTIGDTNCITTVVDQFVIQYIED